MSDLLKPLDLVIFFVSLIAVMGIGLWAGRKEETSEDFYLAGRRTRWWGVAGSIFGSNVSANHIVGMMGVGFAAGFAQSHFEITAIAGLLALCYLFLPVYRRLNIFTLSHYLSLRYNEGCRVIYALIMVLIMVVVQMVPGFYIGSRSLNILLQGGPGDIDPTWYTIGIVGMAVVTATYTIFGGLKAVIVTDVIQSVLMLAAGISVALITYSQPEIGGWNNLVALDASEKVGADMIHLYQPVDHPQLPWTGVLSGLMVLHLFYWGTNQFIVQRALSAGTLREARLGIIAAGFFKLLIPFFSIGTGIAAFYLFHDRGMQVDQDAVFTTLLTELVAPMGYGLVGLIAAGMVGAILSSLDSMMNSAATIFTFDIYQRFIRPDASERQLITVGRICIVVFVTGAALLAILTMDPNSKKSFFLMIAEHQMKLVVGVVVAFLLGMLWRRATATGAFVAMVAGALLSFGLELGYDKYLGHRPEFAEVLGEKINFFHTAFVAAILAAVAHIVISLCLKADPDKAANTWVGLKLFTPRELGNFVVTLGLALAGYAVLGVMMVYEGISPTGAAGIAAAGTFVMFLTSAVRATAARPDESVSLLAVVQNDRFWGGLLAATAIFMMYYFY